MQAFWRAKWPLKSPFDIIRPVSMQHVTCDGLFQKRDNARDSWRFVQDVITMRRNAIRFVTSLHGDHTATCLKELSLWFQFLVIEQIPLSYG